MKFVTRGGFFRRGPERDGHLDPYSIQTISKMPLIGNRGYPSWAAFMWCCEVYFSLQSVSESCVRYAGCFMSETSSPFPAGSIRLPGNMLEMSRFVFDCVLCSCVILCHWRPIIINAHDRVAQNPAGSEVKSTCVDALCWARRFLPFSHFLDAEELLQDILLSLMSELPPLSLVICCLYAEVAQYDQETAHLSEMWVFHMWVFLRWQTRWFEVFQKRKSPSEFLCEKSTTHCCRDWGNAKSSVRTAGFSVTPHQKYEFIKKRLSL